MKNVLAACLGLTLAACGPTVPLLVLAPGAEPRPPSEVVNERLATPRLGTGAISVTTEERRLFSKACTLDVVLDDQLVAGLRPGEQVTIFAEPGRRVVTLNVRDEASCAPESRQVALQIVEHTTQEVRIGTGAHRRMRVEVDPYGRSLPP